ncbi:MAG: hypothetical protein AB7F86_17265 [Bdellovibrionales bacterium]
MDQFKRLIAMGVLLLSWSLGAGEIKSMGVGIVKGEVVTSREVHIQNLLEASLYQNSGDGKILGLDSKAFAKTVQAALLELAISMEAHNFNVVQVGDEELAKLKAQALQSLEKQKAWKDLQVTEAELKRGLIRKAQAKKFIQFRAKSSVLPVTDREAQKYFNENRLKFGDLPYENFKENIKAYLSRTQVERRLGEWYEVLLNKYQVKNLIAEI